MDCHYTMLRLVCGVLWVQLETLHPQTHFSSDYKRQTDMLHALWNNFWTPVDYDSPPPARHSEATQSSTKHYTIPRCPHFREKELAPLLGTYSTMSFSGLGLSYSYKDTAHSYRKATPIYEGSLCTFQTQHTTFYVFFFFFCPSNCTGPDSDRSSSSAIRTVHWAWVILVWQSCLM